MNVLIVDDSVLLRNILKEILKLDNDFKKIYEASNGIEAIQKVKIYLPDLVIMDINMPILDGLNATKEIMRENPVPIVIFTGDATDQNIFQSLKLGALDIIKKPDISLLNDKSFYESFLLKLKELAKKKHLYSKNNKNINNNEVKFKLVVIGASTGGPIAIKQILSKLPANFPLCIIIVQHMEDGFDQGFAEWLNSECDLSVRLAKNYDLLSPGTVLIAPNDKHLVFKGETILLVDGEKVVNQRPSVDVTFKSAADNFNEHVLAVLLTGMGTDGANGALYIKQKNGYTIIQDKESSTIFGMPKAAIELGAACEILNLNDIPYRLLSILKKN